MKTEALRADGREEERVAENAARLALPDLYLGFISTPFPPSLRGPDDAKTLRERVPGRRVETAVTFQRRLLPPRELHVRARLSSRC